MMRVMRVVVDVTNG